VTNCDWLYEKDFLMKIVIPGDPIAKARHRRKRLRDGRIIEYDPQEAEKTKTAKYLTHSMREHFDSKNNEMVMKASELTFAEAFNLNVVLHIPIPKSDSTPIRNAKLWGLIPHNQKPDSSNLLKFYEDAANSVLYDDDSMLCHVSAKKKWSDNPRTEITIMPIKKPVDDEIVILSHISPNELYEMAQLVLKLPKINQECDWSDFITENENRRKAALILSEIADKFSSKFQKINKKSPGFWQKQGNSNG
jgi:Holliday junction resolvase RusA-like endonuclease